MAVGDIFQLVTTYTNESSNGAGNVLHAMVDAEYEPFTIHDVRASHELQWADDLYTFLQTGANKGHVEAHRLSPAPPVFEVGPTIGGTGARAPATAGDAPYNVAAIITKETGLAGRQYRGRIFLPFLADTDISDQQTINAAPMTALNNLAAALMVPLEIKLNGTGILKATARPVLWHKATRTVTVITTMIARTYIASQRRRMAERW